MTSNAIEEQNKFIDGKKNEDIIKVASTCSNEMFLKPISIERKNLLIDVLHEQSSEVKCENPLKLFENEQGIGVNIAGESNNIYKQDDLLKKNTIENVDHMKEPSFSNVSEEEENCSPQSKKLNEGAKLPFSYLKQVISILKVYF